MTGFVSLVGAGPGDPELLTLKAVHRLRDADLVLYDALVGPELTAFAARAQRFCVGKRAGRKSVGQFTIERLMIRAARQGKRVVRLKCGDPFVLGRGGEEALALRDAGVPFEIVPGVTTAIAAPALAGVPVTHRGVASGFVVVSGHAPSSFKPLLETMAPDAATIIVLMGISNRRVIAETLMGRGWRPETPAAVVLAAGTPSMRSWSGRLDELGPASLEAGGAPGTIVIGDVVGLRSLIHGSRADEPTAAAIAFGGSHA